MDCKRPHWLLLLTVWAATLIGCGKQHPPLKRQLLDTSDGTVTIHGDVWADNWFALYVGDRLLIEDSVSITTERSLQRREFFVQGRLSDRIELQGEGFQGRRFWS